MIMKQGYIYVYCSMIIDIGGIVYHHCLNCVNSLGY